MPSVPVNLPSPGSISVKGLDNRELDKLVATLGKSASTWRRALSLYDWLKESGHNLDDRLCTTVCLSFARNLLAFLVSEVFGMCTLDWGAFVAGQPASELSGLLGLGHM
jgi:hypothetical protein